MFFLVSLPLAPLNTHSPTSTTLSQMTTLEHTIPLHPSYFTPSIRAYLKQQLYSRVEGTCSGRLGYIVAVVSMHDEILRGLVVGGQAEFIVKYTAIVYKPFKNEVVDGVVASVNKVGLPIE